MRSEFTIKELADMYGMDKKIRIICEDDETVVLAYSKKQQSLNEQNYSFEAGV